MNYKKRLQSMVSNLPESRILLIVPPFALIDFPCIGLDILQGIANKMGIKTSVLYANILFADAIGKEQYKHISSALMSMHTMLGERIFSKCAYSSKPLLGDNFLKKEDANFTEAFFKYFSIDEINCIAEIAIQWTKDLALELSKKDYEIIGVTSGHQQTNAAISLITEIKSLRPDVLCVIGGSACDGEMAEGVLSLSPHIDYVFSGESEISWQQFLEKFQKRELPTERIIRSNFIPNLDEIDVNEETFRDYYQQLGDLKMDSGTALLYESSRGCWYGEKHKCTFCGVNGWNKHYRYKSAQKVMRDLSTILDLNPRITHIQMVDTLMPRHYMEELLPSLKRKYPTITFFYEQRADLSFEQVMSLKQYGLNYTQVGIEALSTELLLLLNKGIDASKNIRFLRYARSVGLLIGWNLLTEIPNDKKEYWIKSLELIPQIYHLNPPMLIRPVEIARFSPYFESPNEYGIQSLTPSEVYSDILPPSANIDRIAWLFNASFISESKDDSNLNQQIKDVVSGWIDRWKLSKGKLPVLQVRKINDKYYYEDSRLGLFKSEQISYSRAKMALFGISETTCEDDITWGIENKVLCSIDSHYIPLATAHPIIYKELSNE